MSDQEHRFLIGSISVYIGHSAANVNLITVHIYIAVKQLFVPPSIPRTDTCQFKVLFVPPYYIFHWYIAVQGVICTTIYLSLIHSSSRCYLYHQPPRTDTCQFQQLLFLLCDQFTTVSRCYWQRQISCFPLV